MYRTIYIPVDNSEFSNRAIDIGVGLARGLGAKAIGSHVYAAKLHDVRFRQMESGLPEEFQDEIELERQRKIHDTLITRGLEIITDSYLQAFTQRCDALGVAYERRSLEGKNFLALVDDIQCSGYDLVVMGALGMGAVEDSMIGSVCERVVRRVRSDVLVVREPHPRPWGKVVAALDGSHESYGGLRTALAIGKTFGLEVEAIAAFDPYFHYAMFHSIAGVLDERASRVFRFKDQEKLHEEVIDSGLAKIYQTFLDIGKTVAEQEGIPLRTRLLDGKAFEQILRYVREEEPWLLVVGRIGVHSDPGMDLGSNTENLLRRSPCNLLLSSRAFVPPVELQADLTITWSKEAKERMGRIPGFARGMASTAILKFAIEKGHTVITSALIDEAVGAILPAGALEAMGRLALERAALEAAESDAARAAASAPADGALRDEGNGGSSVMADPPWSPRAAKILSYSCPHCGHTVRGYRPAICLVCGEDGSAFRPLSDDSQRARSHGEGGLEEVATFDQSTLTWTEEALRRIAALPVGHVRDKARARVEKKARVRGAPLIDLLFVEEVLEDTSSAPSLSPSARVADAPHAGGEAASELTWAPEARARLERVPAGFMRDTTHRLIQAAALSRGASWVTLAIAEEGILDARVEMENMIASRAQEKSGTACPSPEVPEPYAPFYVCGSCGYLTEEAPARACPVCGAAPAAFSRG